MWRMLVTFDILDYVIIYTYTEYIHEETKAQIEFLLTMLAQKGEEETFSYIRRELLGKKA